MNHPKTSPDSLASPATKGTTNSFEDEEEFQGYEEDFESNDLESEETQEMAAPKSRTNSVWNSSSKSDSHSPTLAELAAEELASLDDDSFEDSPKNEKNHRLRLAESPIHDSSSTSTSPLGSSVDFDDALESDHEDDDVEVDDEDHDSEILDESFLSARENLTEENLFWENVQAQTANNTSNSSSKMDSTVSPTLKTLPFGSSPSSSEMDDEVKRKPLIANDRSTQFHPFQPLASGFVIDSFTPGFRSGTKKRIHVDKDKAAAIAKPDFDFDDVDYRDTQAMKTLLSRILSLGVRGEIILKVNNNSSIKNIKGPDFAVFENPFPNTQHFFELAEVAVSEDGKKYHAFPCNPGGTSRERSGCAGFTTREEGGDLYDLELLGLTQIRYIRLRDMSPPGTPSASKHHTDGFDLDAVVITGR